MNTFASTFWTTAHFAIVILEITLRLFISDHSKLLPYLVPCIMPSAVACRPSSSLVQLSQTMFCGLPLLIYCVKWAELCWYHMWHTCGHKKGDENLLRVWFCQPPSWFLLHEACRRWSQESMCFSVCHLGFALPTTSACWPVTRELHLKQANKTKAMTLWT